MQLAYSRQRIALYKQPTANITCQQTTNIASQRRKFDVVRFDKWLKGAMGAKGHTVMSSDQSLRQRNIGLHITARTDRGDDNAQSQLGALYIFARTGVDLDHVPFFDEVGNLELGAGFHFDFLQHTPRCVAAQCNVSLHHPQRDEVRNLD